MRWLAVSALHAAPNLLSVFADGAHPRLTVGTNLIEHAWRHGNPGISGTPATKKCMFWFRRLWWELCCCIFFDVFMRRCCCCLLWESACISDLHLCCWRMLWAVLVWVWICPNAPALDPHQDLAPFAKSAPHHHQQAAAHRGGNETFLGNSQGKHLNSRCSFAAFHFLVFTSACGLSSDKTQDQRSACCGDGCQGNGLCHIFKWSRLFLPQ